MANVSAYLILSNYITMLHLMKVLLNIVTTRNSLLVLKINIIIKVYLLILHIDKLRVNFYWRKFNSRTFSIYFDIKNHEAENTEQKGKIEKMNRCAVYLLYTPNRQSDRTNLMRMKELNLMTCKFIIFT